MIVVGLVKKIHDNGHGQYRVSIGHECKMLGLLDGDEVIMSIRAPCEYPEGGYWGGDVIGLMEAGFAVKNAELGIKLALHPCFTDEGVKSKIIAAQLEDKIVNGKLYKKDVWHDDVDVSLDVIYKYTWDVEPLQFAGTLFNGAIMGDGVGGVCITTPYNRLDPATARKLNELVMKALRKKPPAKYYNVAAMDQDLVEMIAEAKAKIDAEEGQSVLDDDLGEEQEERSDED